MESESKLLAGSKEPLVPAKNKGIFSLKKLKRMKTSVILKSKKMKTINHYSPCRNILHILHHE